MTIFSLTSVGTAFSFAKLLPLFRLHREPRRGNDRLAAYAVLAVPILLFIPVALLAVPSLAPGTVFSPFHLVESVGTIVVGALLYRTLHRRMFSLPQRVFHLEEATLVILVGLLLVFFLLQLS